MDKAFIGHICCKFKGNKEGKQGKRTRNIGCRCRTADEDHQYMRAVPLNTVYSERGKIVLSCQILVLMKSTIEPPTDDMTRSRTL